MKKDFESLGDRMKFYEHEFAVHGKAMKGIPLLARLDGKSFHSFTRGMARPYSQPMSLCMIGTTKYLVDETNALVGYTQSDEISLLWFLEADSKSEYMFSGKGSKLISILAAKATAKFNQLVAEHMPEYSRRLPVFDCRLWQVPTKDEAVNAFLWRELDATKNSISMAAHSMFSHKSLHGMSGSEKQERMWKERGVNWNDYPAFFKRGTYVQRKVFEHVLDSATMEKIPEKHRANISGPVLRSEVVTLDLPPIQKVSNRVEVLFNKQQPLSETAI